jgi:Protein of unknown function (DUF3592)
MVAFGIGLIVISLGCIVAGRGYIRIAKRMRSYATTRGRVTRRGLARTSGDNEGRWGQGGNYRPDVTFVFSVEGVEHTSDKVSYAHRGLRQSAAEAALAAIPDDVEVHYDPEHPEQAYLEKHTPRIGYWFVGGGVFGILLGLVMLMPA